MVDIIKIENYEGTPETFTLPYNPETYQEGNETFNNIDAVEFQNFHFMFGTRSMKPKQISFTGNLSQAVKDEQYEDLAHRLNDGSRLYKLYFRDSRFHIVGCTNFQKTHTNIRTNFIDYITSFIAPIPLAFGSELKEASFNGSSWTNGNLENTGGTFTYIKEVVITLGSGNSSGDTIILNSNGRGGITYTLGKSYSNGNVLTIRMIRYELSNSIWQTKFFNMVDNVGDVVSKRRSTDKQEFALTLEKGARIDTYSIGGTANISNVVFKFRDGFTGG